MWRRRPPQMTPTVWNSAALTAQLDPELDALLKLLPAGVVGEILYYAPGPKCLVTLAIRPDTAVLLPTRLRSGDALAGRVLETGKGFGGRVEPSMGAQRLHGTRSALVLPVRAQGQPSGNLLGAVNFESYSEMALTDRSGNGFEGALARIAAALSDIPATALPDDASVTRYLLDKIEREIAFILDPQRIPEIYRQFRQATSRLTSQLDSYASIILKREDAQQLEFVGDPAESDEDEKDHQWVVPVPNVGDAIDLPGEWDLLAEPSITKLVMDSGVPELIRDVTAQSEQGRRKPLAVPYDRGSELNMPIADMDGVFGTIILLSPYTNAFTKDDQRMAARMARYIVMVTRRIESFRSQIQQDVDAKERNAFKDKIDELISPLYTANDVFPQISSICDQALGLIAEEARVRTRSDVGAIVLDERRSAKDESHELVWNEAYCSASRDLAPDNALSYPFRIASNVGLVGYTFQSDKQIVQVQNVERPDRPELEGKYYPAFKGVRSELVALIQGRRQRWGVIDVESKIIGNYKKSDQQWLRFLAEETVEVLEAVELASRRWFLDRLSRFDRAIDKMRSSSDVKEIQDERAPLFEQLIKETCEFSGADKAQLYVVLNAYDDSGQLRRMNGNALGSLGAVVSWPSGDVDQEGFQHHIQITEGMAGPVIESGKRDFFRDEEDRPDGYIDNLIHAKSALVEPILEGKRVIGILNLESSQTLWCGELQRRLVRYAARLASYIYVNYKMCLESAQSKILHRFGLATEQILRPDIAAYLDRVLAAADTLTISPDTERWAQVALVHDGVIDFGPCLLTPDNRYIKGDKSSGDPVIYQPLLQLLKDLKSRFIPNIEAPEMPHDNEKLPWEKAKSLICVPLVVRSGDDQDAPDAAIGYLTVASSLPYYLNDSDHAILRSFAEAVTHGLLDLAHLYSRASLLREMRERFGAFRLANKEEMQDLSKQIREIGDVKDESRRIETAIAVREKFLSIEKPFRMMGQIPRWYFILSSYYPSAKDIPTALSSTGDVHSKTATGGVLSSSSDNHKTVHALSSGEIELGEIEKTLSDLMSSYVEEQAGGKVYWRWASSESLKKLRIRVGHDAESGSALIAAVFGCIATASAASRKGDANGHDIRVNVSSMDKTSGENASASERSLVFSVRYDGRPISMQAFSVLPRYRSDEDTQYGTFGPAERRLVDVQRIVKTMNGTLLVASGEDNREHSITLEIPYVDAQERK